MASQEGCLLALPIGKAEGKKEDLVREKDLRLKKILKRQPHGAITGPLNN